MKLKLILVLFLYQLLPSSLNAGGNIGIMFIPIQGCSPTSEVILSGTSYTYNGPCTNVKIWAVGAGAGGMGSDTANKYGKGGGAGGVSYRQFSISAGDTINFTIGAGSSGSGFSGGNVQNGGQTSSGGSTSVTFSGVTISGLGGGAVFSCNGCNFDAPSGGQGGGTTSSSGPNDGTTGGGSGSQGTLDYGNYSGTSGGAIGASSGRPNGVNGTAPLDVTLGNDVSGLFEAVQAAGYTTTQAPATLPANTFANRNNVDGPTATCFGCGGGAAGSFGGSGGAGGIGGGGGGAAGQDTTFQSGGNGGNGAVVLRFF